MLEKGAIARDNNADEVFVREVDDIEEDVTEEENAIPLEAKELADIKQDEVEENAIPLEAKELADIKQDEIVDEVENDSDYEGVGEILDEGSKSKHVEQFKREKFVEEKVSEKLREFESEFERIIPELIKEPNVKDEYEKSDEELELETAEKEINEINSDNEFESDIDEDIETNETDIASLPKKEKEKILKEIVELYEKEINEQNGNVGRKPKKKVSMSVNGKSAFRASAPLFNSKKSNSAMLGDASFNIRKHEYASYYKHIRDKISLFWMLFFGTDQSIKLRTDENKPIIVEFKVRPFRYDNRCHYCGRCWKSISRVKDTNLGDKYKT